MKIICVGRNYSEHARELKNEVPDKPVIFLKPDTALLKDNKPFYLPDWSDEIHHEAELVYRISRNGKHIQEQFAQKYINAVTLGIDFTARDLQSELKSKGLPWELSKGFDNSAVLGKWLSFEELKDSANISFTLKKNSEAVQQGMSEDMLFSISKIIAFVSGYITLKTGDLIYTGTPSGVSKITQGDLLEGFIEERQVFTVNVK